MLVATPGASEWGPLDRGSIVKIIRILNKRYGFEKYSDNPFRTLIGVVLSHQTTDKISHPAAERLFKHAKTPQQFVRLGVKKIDGMIKNVNLHPTKARRIVAICKMLIEKFGAKVPKTREELMELPGVGGKSADVILLFAYGQPVIPCDTHVIWVSNQLKWTNSQNPEKVREDLHKLIPPEKRFLINHLLVRHGREICIKNKPKCQICPIEKYCPSSRLRTNKLR